MPLRWFDDHPAGELLAHADADCERATMAMQPLPFSLGVIVIIVVSMVQLAFVDPALLGVGLALFPSLALLNNAYTKRVERPAATAQARVGDVSAVAHESFEGVLVVKTLGLEEREVGRLDAAAQELRAGRAWPSAGCGPASSRASTPSPASAPWCCCGSAPGGSRRARSPPASSSRRWPCSASSRSPSASSASSSRSCPRAVVAHDRITKVLAAEPRGEPSEPVPLPDGALDVVVDDVSFAYGDDLVLRDVRARLAPGEVVALVGSTGSGKTTLCNLLAHLVDPTLGQIRLGGVDLDDRGPCGARAGHGVRVPGDLPLRRLRAGEPLPRRSPTTTTSCGPHSRWPAPTASCTACGGASTR